MEGVENNIKWTATYGYDPVIISIYDLNNNLLEQQEYKCIRAPIFGYDWEDVDNINKLIDDLIKKYKKETK